MHEGLQKNKNDTDTEIIMNNLELLIKKSGYSKQEFAKLRGITPATLSRHMHGHIDMTAGDAERYAELLNCDPVAVMFKSTPVPHIASTYCKTATHINGDSQSQNTSANIRRVLHTVPKYEFSIPSFHFNDMCAMQWNTEDKHTDQEGLWYGWDGALSLYPIKPIRENHVHKACFQERSLIKLAKTHFICGHEQDLITGMVFPQPGGSFTVHNPETNTLIEKIEIVWATPLISVIHRPDLRGIVKQKV